MANRLWMQKFARWHIWLGWLVGVPILMWLATGLFMVLKPFEEVRGEHLRIETAQRALPAGSTTAVTVPEAGRPVQRVSTAMEGDEVVTTLTYTDGAVERFAEDGSRIAPLNEIAARLLVEERIEGGDAFASATFYEADDVPFDFRRPQPVWRIALDDGTYVYVGRDTGRIEAVRTRWWRWFDFMWGLHVMDLETREPSNHPIILIFGTLAVFGALFGTVLMFRRRKARVKAR
jgi:hypothetical protein